MKHKASGSVSRETTRQLIDLWMSRETDADAMVPDRTGGLFVSPAQSLKLNHRVRTQSAQRSKRADKASNQARHVEEMMAKIMVMNGMRFKKVRGTC